MNEEFSDKTAICAVRLFWTIFQILTAPYAWYYQAMDWMAKREEGWIAKADDDGGPPPVNYYK